MCSNAKLWFWGVFLLSWLLYVLRKWTPRTISRGLGTVWTSSPAKTRSYYAYLFLIHRVDGSHSMNCAFVFLVFPGHPAPSVNGSLLISYDVGVIFCITMWGLVFLTFACLLLPSHHLIRFAVGIRLFNKYLIHGPWSHCFLPPDDIVPTLHWGDSVSPFDVSPIPMFFPVLFVLPFFPIHTLAVVFPRECLYVVENLSLDI